ncbi:hypothetical protein [Saccharothrix deserti]|nr:hypothetical protein [Saccharothrix deserti]
MDDVKPISAASASSMSAWRSPVAGFHTGAVRLDSPAVSLPSIR